MADYVKKIKVAGGPDGGTPIEAEKLSSNAGSATQPVYFNDGKPVTTTYTLGASVPANAKFTDTTYTLSSFGVTATAAELNILDGVTATATELNYCDGVTSNIQTQINGKAASSHNHGAGEITSGTLAVGRGGTGVTSNPSMLTNLGSTTAASVFAASPRPGITGTLPIAHGGTGATSASAARTNLGVITPNDYVVEQGKSGNTYYRKWNSGAMEQWYSITSSSQAINTKYGDTALYYGTHTWTFPIAFKSISVVLCTCFRYGTGVSWGSSWGPTTSSATLCGYDFYSRAAGNDTCHITAYAQGTWK